jgi:Fe2+ transport system protein FeoA
MKTKAKGSLSSARCGERLRITAVRQDSSATNRLRELGFCESAEICKVADNGTCLCMLMGMRVAIGRDLAESVFVERISNAA